LRNVLIAAGNSGDPSFADRLVELLDDDSALVRGAAVWALSRLLDKTDLADLSRRRQPKETDPNVQAEWTAVQRQ
jgi:epoxyqueuosine reductase